MSLSDKIREIREDELDVIHVVVHIDFIKEAVKELKESLIGELLERGAINGLDRIPQEQIRDMINQIFGDKLI